jgi:hypothetical protein
MSLGRKLASSFVGLDYDLTRLEGHKFRTNYTQCTEQIQVLWSVGEIE